MNPTEKYQFIHNTVVSYNAGHNPTREQINAAFNYYHELIDTKQYPGNELDARQMGSALADALSNSCS